MNRLSLAIVALVLASSCPIKITLPVPPIPSPVPSASPSVVPTPSPEPSPVATPSPEPTPTPEPSQKPPSPPPVKACIQSIPGPVPPGAIWKNGCPKGYDEVPGYKACIAHSSCEHPDSSGQCWDIPGYDVNDPNLQYGCFSCLSLTHYNLSSGYRALDAFGFLGVGPKYKPNPGKPIPGPQDALCRVKQDDGSWKDKDNVCPPCIGTPEPQPSPVATPVPSASPSEFNCNGSWSAPSCDMKISRISMSVFYVMRDGAPVKNCSADDACPARVGDKVFFNSTPRYEDSRCTRGAAIPDNCVGLPQFAYQAQWDGATRDDGDNSLGYLASWKADESGSRVVQVCVGSSCASVKVVVR